MLPGSDGRATRLAGQGMADSRNRLKGSWLERRTRDELEIVLGQAKKKVSQFQMEHSVMISDQVHEQESGNANCNDSINFGGAGKEKVLASKTCVLRATKNPPGRPDWVASVDDIQAHTATIYNDMNPVVEQVQPVLVHDGAI